MPKNIGRINLSFNLDNKSHREIYELLKSKGRNKTGFVIDRFSKSCVVTDSGALGIDDIKKLLESTISKALRVNAVTKPEIKETLKQTIGKIEIEVNGDIDIPDDAWDMFDSIGI